jgi:hypothetical protein
MTHVDAPYGYVKTVTIDVTPKPAPPEPPDVLWTWHIGLPTTKSAPVVATGNVGQPERIVVTMQMTADQQVDLSITGEDKYGNPVAITGDVAWVSSDETIVTVQQHSQDPSQATAFAVGPAGTAAVTVTNDVDRDGTGDFMGSLAVDIVAGNIAEVVVVAAEPTDKVHIEPQA